MSRKHNLSKPKGQVVLEYVLLFSAAIAISFIVMRTLVGTAEEPSGIRSAWIKMINAIGKDYPDK